MQESWIVILLFANQQLAWLPVDRSQCFAIAAAVSRGQDVGLTGLNGKRRKVLNARCLSKHEAEKLLALRKGEDV